MTFPDERDPISPEGHEPTIRDVGEKLLHAFDPYPLTRQDLVELDFIDYPDQFEEKIAAELGLNVRMANAALEDFLNSLPAGRLDVKSLHLAAHLLISEEEESTVRMKKIQSVMNNEEAVDPVYSAAKLDARDDLYKLSKDLIELARDKANQEALPTALKLKQNDPDVMIKFLGFERVTDEGLSVMRVDGVGQCMVIIVDEDWTRSPDYKPSLIGNLIVIADAGLNERLVAKLLASPDVVKYFLIDKIRDRQGVLYNALLAKMQHLGEMKKLLLQGRVEEINASVQAHFYTLLRDTAIAKGLFTFTRITRGTHDAQNIIEGEPPRFDSEPPEGFLSTYTVQPYYDGILIHWTDMVPDKQTNKRKPVRCEVAVVWDAEKRSFTCINVNEPTREDFDTGRSKSYTNNDDRIHGLLTTMSKVVDLSDLAQGRDAEIAQAHHAAEQLRGTEHLADYLRELNRTKSYPKDEYHFGDVKSGDDDPRIERRLVNALKN